MLQSGGGEDETSVLGLLRPPPPQAASSLPPPWPVPAGMSPAAQEQDPEPGLSPHRQGVNGSSREKAADPSSQGHSSETSPVALEPGAARCKL